MQSCPQSLLIIDVTRPLYLLCAQNHRLIVVFLCISFKLHRKQKVELQTKVTAILASITSMYLLSPEICFSLICMSGYSRCLLYMHKENNLLP